MVEITRACFAAERRPRTFQVPIYMVVCYGGLLYPDAWTFVFINYAGDIVRCYDGAWRLPITCVLVVPTGDWISSASVPALFLEGLIGGA